MSGDGLARAMEAAFESYGPLGVLVLALVSNLIPGFPAIYLTLVFSYAAVDRGGKLGLLIVILAGGLGAGLGKFVEFYLSDVLSSRVAYLQRKKRSLQTLLARTKWEIAFLVFLFAALPLPDDVLYIPLGAAGFSRAAFIVSVTLGKIVLTAIAAGLGELAGWLFEESTLASIVFITVGTLILLAIMFAIDWEKVVKAYNESGWRAAGGALKVELSRILDPRNWRRGR